MLTMYVFEKNTIVLRTIKSHALVKFRMESKFHVMDSLFY